MHFIDFLDDFFVISRMIVFNLIFIFWGGSGLVILLFIFYIFSPPIILISINALFNIEIFNLDRINFHVIPFI